MACSCVPSTTARAAYWPRNSSVFCLLRAVYRASWYSRVCNPMVRGSSFDFVQCARFGHARQSCLAKRASKTMPVLGIGVRMPGNTLLARRARHHAAIPVHGETSLIESPAASLPAWVPGHRADDKRKGHALHGRSLVSWWSVRANLNCCCPVDSIYPTVFRPGSSPNNCGKCSRSNPASCSDLQAAALHIGARIACPCMFSSNQYPILVSVS
jgi:hypothetical protein